MYAMFSRQPRCCLPFADFHVNLRDGTTRIFRCQFVRVVIERIRKINLSINHTLIRSDAWQDKAQLAMFLQRFVVSLFPAWDNCSKAGW
jgi:hypothetical protein